MAIFTVPINGCFSRRSVWYTSMIGPHGNHALALIAYNSGENRLKKAIKEVGSSDPETLAKNSRILTGENKAYLDRFMAYLIIMQNPNLLN